jgi:hypothetical protein
VERGSLPRWATNQSSVVYGCTGRLINSITSRLEDGLGSIPSATTKHMKEEIRSRDIWNSIGYIGERSDFFRFSQTLVKRLTEFCQKDTNLKVSLDNSKIFVVGTVKDIPIQRVMLVWKDTPTYRLMDKLGQDATTEEELDSIVTKLLEYKTTNVATKVK